MDDKISNPVSETDAKLLKGLGGVGLVVTIIFTISFGLMIVILIKRQILRMLLISKRGPHTTVGADAPRTLLREIELRLRRIAVLRIEPRMMSEQFNKQAEEASEFDSPPGSPVTHLKKINMADEQDEEGQFKNVLIGVTGSVATIKLGKLIQELRSSKMKLNVQVVATDHSTHFFDCNEIPVKVYRDTDEWQNWKKIGDPVLHIELRKWADIMVIAPLDANTMAKIVGGLCDNLMTCIVRAWDMEKPLIFCPAMNTHMWNHPITSSHVDSLRKIGYIYVPPVEKKLACGDTGTGAMAEVSTIIDRILETLQEIHKT